MRQQHRGPPQAQDDRWPWVITGDCRELTGASGSACPIPALLCPKIHAQLPFNPTSPEPQELDVPHSPSQTQTEIPPVLAWGHWDSSSAGTVAQRGAGCAADDGVHPQVPPALPGSQAGSLQSDWGMLPGMHTREWARHHWPVLVAPVTPAPTSRCRCRDGLSRAGSGAVRAAGLRAQPWLHPRVPLAGTK